VAERVRTGLPRKLGAHPRYPRALDTVAVLEGGTLIAGHRNQRHGKRLRIAVFETIVTALLTPGYGRSHDEHVELERISVDHRVKGGVPCVAGTRIPVATVVGSVASGLTTDEILAEYPQLTRDDIQACLAYAAGNADVCELPIQADAARIHDLLAEAAVAPLPGGTGLTEQRAEELISEIQASRKTR
jgi:uncharacterized protein (DUF433 family)